MSPAQTGKDRGTEREEKEEEGGGAERWVISSAVPWRRQHCVPARVCMCLCKCHRITVPGWLNWHHGAPEQGAATDDRLEPSATGAVQRTCGTKCSKRVFKYICDSISNNIKIQIGMFLFEPVPQKVTSPLTSASQMKSSPRLSHTKFTSSLLNKDRVGWVLKKKAHLKGRNSCVEPGIQMQQMKAKMKWGQRETEG